MAPLLTIQDLSVAGRLGPFNAEVFAGERLHLIGPNGAGKSTLLSCMAGLQPAQGKITFAGQALTSWTPQMLARLRAFCPQQQLPPFSQPLWHFLSLHQSQLDDEGLADIAGALGLADKLNRSVNALSGGEWQRARLAAVLLQVDPRLNAEGRLLLLDEPFNNLDVAQQAALDSLLDKLSQRGLAIVLSSHDLNHTLHHAQRVWLMQDGNLAMCGEPKLVVKPENLRKVWDLSFHMVEAEGQHFILVPGADPGLPAQAWEAKLP
ncbi:vitamin B12 import ATP-binding protein BtuD [Salmonella enterica subsp. enterica serovar Choleraesuis]|nr:vitamin B12 import ATP-binding protein BtuD [Salmonella enterica subsp. enterica serovar Choleraesuis]